MDDEQLERRLRTDPAADDGHVPGRFVDRLAGSAAQRRRPTAVGGVGRPVGAALLGLAALVVVLVVRLTGTAIGPGSSPIGSPTVPPTRGAVDAVSLQAALDRWGADHHVASGSVAVLDALGGMRTVSLAGGPPGDSGLMSRIGSVSGMYVVTATLVLIDCARTSQADCPLPAATGAMRLDDPVSRWLPDSPAGDRTIRQLLDGTSGLASLDSIDELNRRIAADPGADWSRTAVLTRALESPERFAAGARREPVETEIALLEELLQRASGMSAERWIDGVAIGHLGLRQTEIGPVDSGRLAPGRTADGAAVPDLSPTLLDALGTSRGSAADAPDLARFAAAAWGTALIQDVATLRLATDAANGHRSPMGATAYCPCVAGENSVIGRTGQAVGWSAVAAYDFASATAVGVALASDVPSDQLDALLRDVLAALRR